MFTEQGSSASQMTAAKVMDVIARLPGCAGQAADAVSAYTQVTMEDAPRLLKLPKSECPDTWTRLPRHTWPNERNLYGRPLAGLFWKRSSRKFCWHLGGKEYRLGNVFLFTGSKVYSDRCTWMTLKWLERSRIWLRCGRN